MHRLHVVPVCGDARGRSVSLLELAAGRAIVMDLWKSQCPKCPAAISTLAAKAKVYQKHHILFLAVNIDDMEHAELMAESSSQLDTLTHVFMDNDNKEALKTLLGGFSKVPYCIMVARDGSVVDHGMANTMDYKRLETLLFAESEFRLDEEF